MRVFLLPLFFLSEPALGAPVNFVREVRPILEKHCYECHGATKQKSGLRLDIKALALKGGDNHGPDILPGQAKDSPLIHFLTAVEADEAMPPKGRLPAAEIAMLTRWINEGAVWPDGVDVAKAGDKRDHWAFKPLLSQSLHRDIDGFIDEKLAAHGLRRSTPADPIVWLRRVTLDLTGLPPAPEEVVAFMKDGDHAAVVERLLASPRYGERWAQHWLDVVRYADTHGFEVNTERPNAWPYRDYVIRAFNEDRPYDRFIQEQIAGDALAEDAATGFLVTASVLLPGQIGKDEPSKRLARQDSIDEIVTNVGQTFLGLSIGCARCHDHKFDPISSREYYGMQAFVAGVEYGERELRTPETAQARERLAEVKSLITESDWELARFVPLAKSGVKRPMVSSRENRDRFHPVSARRLRFTIRATTNLEPCLDEIEVLNVAGENVALGAAVTVSGENLSADRHEQRFVNDGQYGNSRSWMSNRVGKGWVTLEFAREQAIDRVVWGRDRQGKFKDRLATSYVIEVADASGVWKAVADSDDRLPYETGEQTEPDFSTQGLTRDEAVEMRRLIDQRRSLDQEQKRLENSLRVFAGTFRTPDDIHLLNRGDPEQPRESVVPSALSVLGSLELPGNAPDQLRRVALANWIASPDNPLTARVMVNRVWQGHFGTGIVATPSDFGRMGMKPTHPELLDWLAAEFIRGGWSVKHLHRLIVLSQTYRQSSVVRPEGTEKDADGRLLWRYPSRRMDAETIRDSILAVSGNLNLEMHGRGYDLFDKRGGLSGFKPVEVFTPVNQRRMIYAHKVRRESEAVFGAFDCPDAGQSTALRRASTTPIQALNLFNSRFTLEHAEAFASRVKREAGGEWERQIDRVYEIALHRAPSPEELRDAEPVVREHGLAVLCRAIFNSSEFLFVP